MTIKFLAKSHSGYKGLDGRGGIMELKAGDVREVSEEIGNLLLQRYGMDFQVVIEPKPLHTPKADKLAKKTASFKSK